jgi:hypothetical protein
VLQLRQVLWEGNRECYSTFWDMYDLVLYTGYASVVIPGHPPSLPIAPLPHPPRHPSLTPHGTPPSLPMVPLPTGLPSPTGTRRSCRSCSRSRPSSF